MWFPESALILQLNKSAQYQRVLICIYTLTVSVLCCSTFWVTVKIVGCMYLVIHGILLIDKGMPSTRAMFLIYAAHQWSCQVLPSQETEKLDSMRLLVHSDLLILLRLTPMKGRSKILVVFRDQLTDMQLRRLMWVMYAS